MSSNNKKQVPEWSSQLTENLISPLPSSSLVIHSQTNNEQFENYIDQQFTSNDAKVLKNRLSETPSKKPSEATTLRNSSTIPPNYWSDIKELESKQKPLPKPLSPHERENSENSSDLESQNEWWLAKNDQDGFHSISALLFVFGFLFPPLWWIGAFWPRHIKQRGGKMAERWQKLNKIMSVGFSIILVVLIIVFVVIYAKTGF